MNRESSNPLVRFDKPKADYPLMIAWGATATILVAGIIVTTYSGSTIAAIMFLTAFFLLVVAVLLDVAKTRRLEAVDDRKFIRWDAAMPEIQRQNVNVEVLELARLLGVGDDQLTDLLSAYIVAEDLALRQIQQEENLPLMRHVQIGGSHFDGILVNQDLVVCIEVTFLVTPDVRREKIEAMFKKITQAQKNLAEQKCRLRLRLMIVLVTQLTADEEEILRGVLVSRRLTDTPVDTDIRMLDFEMLQRVYISEQ